MRKAISALQLTPEVGQGIIHAQTSSPLDYVIFYLPVMRGYLCTTKLSVGASVDNLRSAEARYQEYGSHRYHADVFYCVGFKSRTLLERSLP